jgi:hypothetical protein
MSFILGQFFSVSVLLLCLFEGYSVEGRNTEPEKGTIKRYLQCIYMQASLIFKTKSN